MTNSVDGANDDPFAASTDDEKVEQACTIFAEFTRKDPADVMDEALLRSARVEGFELPPKR